MYVSIPESAERQHLLFRLVSQKRRNTTVATITEATRHTTGRASWLGLDAPQPSDYGVKLQHASAMRLYGH
jgi:hypothetical protein